MVNVSGRFIGIILVITLILVVSGCGSKGPDASNEPAKQETNNAANKDKDVMDSYNALMQKKDVSIPEIITFIDDNISAVSQQNASSMVIGLEKVQKEKLLKLQDRFANSEVVQKTLIKGYQNGMTDSYMNSVPDQEVKSLLLETKNSGFKIENAEGMFFPIVDYSSYRKYRAVVTPDITAYIDIMAAESDKTPIKDAGLVVSWAEILKRAETQELFIKEYVNSAKNEDVRQLLKRYAAFALYGANNTPLFDYETKQMVPDAKKTYLETLFNANNGSFSKVMIAYLDVLKKNAYKLTDEVQEYRNKASEEI